MRYSFRQARQQRRRISSAFQDFRNYFWPKTKSKRIQSVWCTAVLVPGTACRRWFLTNLRLNFYTFPSPRDQAMMFMAGANSIFTGDRLLTTSNPEFDADKVNRLLIDATHACSFCSPVFYSMTALNTTSRRSSHRGSGAICCFVGRTVHGDH